jgi:AAA15 family ATPase/GTPase
MITRLSLERFTAFENLDMEFVPGVNLMIGDNGTGKTHVLKLIYTALAARQENRSFSDKIKRVFLPKENRIGRLVKRAGVSSTAKVRVYRDRKLLSLAFSSHTKKVLRRNDKWEGANKPAVYIPVKEMLANAPGFRSLYTSREIHFEEVYADIIDRAFLPLMRGPIPKERKSLLDILHRIMKGKVVRKGEEFYLKNKQGELEFTLLAEGVRKFALLWLLIQNQTLLKGATLFWDEPEANINPSMIRALVEILIHLQRMGVQVFIATHSYVVLKEFELLREKKDSLRFFSLKRDDSSGEIECEHGDDYHSIMPNKVSQAFTDLYDREVARSLAGG